MVNGSWVDGYYERTAQWYCASFHEGQSLAQCSCIRVRFRLFHERYGAERGAIKRRTSELARRVPSRDNATEMMKKIILARRSLTLVSAKTRRSKRV